MQLLKRSCAVALAITLPACVATSSSAPTRGVVVNGPPPAPLPEARSAPPSADAMWLEGYWHWTGAQYTWIPGHWERPPPGATWYGPRYVTADGSHFYEPGGWRAGPSGGSARPPSTLPSVPANRSAFH